MKLLFKLTSRSRPQKFFEALDSIINNVSADCDYEILCTLDSDDPSMNSREFKKKRETYLDKVNLVIGESKNKIDAINRDIDLMDWDKWRWDILVNVSDDNRFTKKDFDKDIVDAFWDGYMENVMYDQKRYNLDMCIHFPDQNQGTNCMTMSIMGRTYYHRDNFIYNPAFESLWCDVVAQEIAQLRNCYKFVPTRIFVHNHPSFDRINFPYDELYIKNEGHEVRMRDYATYRKLKTQYDPLTIYPIRNP